jgi:hypothetical protein
MGKEKLGMFEKIRDPEDIKTTLDDRDNIELYMFEDDDE